MKTVILVLVLGLLASAATQCPTDGAPGDHDSNCRSGINQRNFPAEWRVLLDTYDYENLYSSIIWPNSGSLTAAWANVDRDGDSRSWQSFVGGSCTWNLFSNTPGPLQSNWLFSQYICYQDAKEVLLDATYRRSGGRPIFLHRYDVDNPQSFDDRINEDNYQHLASLDQRSDSLLLKFLRPQQSNGFYLGLKDTGVINGQINRLIAYYIACPGKQIGLVVYPEFAAPPWGGPDEEFSAECVSNAHAVDTLTVTASGTDGTCTDKAPGGARCECNLGYVISGGGLSCIACGAGTYRSHGYAICQPCPANTITGATNASICECLDGFYRATDEGPQVDCTAPPGKVTELSIIQKESTSITITWNRPALTGRSDFYYKVLIAETNLLGVNVVEAEVVDGGATVSYTISGLKSFTNYVITVETHNGVSDQDSQEQKQPEVLAATAQGIPSVPTLKRLCTVLIWKPPADAAGILASYDVCLGCDNNNCINLSVDDDNFLLTTPAERAANIDVRIRARNSNFPGEWSDCGPIECANFVDPKPECTLPPLVTQAPTEPSPPVTQGPPTEPACDANLIEFRLDDETIPAGSTVNLEDIGEGDDALHCHTPYDHCCKQQVRGEFYDPNSVKVGRKSGSGELYRNRDAGFIRLNHRHNGGALVLGEYRCCVPDGCGVDQCISINLVE